jgi:hypothetical protein
MMIPSLLQNKVNPSKRVMSSYSGCSKHDLRLWERSYVLTYSWCSWGYGMNVKSP